MLSGIKDIVIVCAKKIEIFTKIIGKEEYLGVNIKYAFQEKP